MARIIITGANGFIGSHLLQYFNSGNHKTIAWVRDTSSFIAKAQKVSFFDVSMPERASWPEHSDVLIHCAWMMYEKNNGANLKNLRCVEYLSRECQHRGIAFVFFSSFSAHPGALSNYGKTKLAAEKLLNINTSLILKPGLVLGDGGVYRRMQKMVESSFFLPIPGLGNMSTQIISINDLCKIVETLICEKAGGEIYLAHPKPVSMKMIYRAIVKNMNKTRIILPLPFLLVLKLAQLADFLGIRLEVSSENLLGIKNNCYVDTSQISNRFSLLSLEQAMNENSSD